MVVSKRQVDRAGDVLRAAELGDDVDDEMLAGALEIADSFRASHEVTLDRTRDGLLMVSSHLVAREFSDRLKRLETIQGKLIRESSLKLSRMRDIAGCRLVVPSQSALEDVASRLMQNSPGVVVRVIDYVVNPRPTGYRGIHVIIRQSDRLAEIQLRTQLMHRWAQISEGIQPIEDRERAATIGDAVAVWLHDLGEALAFEDRGETIPSDVRARVQEAPLDVVEALTIRWRS